VVVGGVCGVGEEVWSPRCWNKLRRCELSGRYTIATTIDLHDLLTKEKHLYINQLDSFESIGIMIYFSVRLIRTQGNICGAILDPPTGQASLCEVRTVPDPASYRVFIHGRDNNGEPEGLMISLQPQP
jgi:hypothetical protein